MSLYDKHMIEALGMAAMAESFLSPYGCVPDKARPKKKKKPLSIRNKRKNAKKSKRNNRRKK